MRSEMTATAREGLNKIFEFIEANNGGFDPRMEHPIEPQVARRVEQALFKDDGFLSRIKLELVDSPVGEVISPETGKRVTNRTRSQQGSNNALPFAKRRPTILGNFNRRDHYFTLEMKQDVMIYWRVLDRLLREKRTYNAIKAYERKQRRDDLITAMWNGQFAMADTDLDTYPELQDLMRGFPQYLIDVAPEQVHGITLDDTAPGGYTVDEIRIGPGAGDNGFETIAQAVHYLKNKVVHRNFRNKPGTRGFAGDDLIVNDEAKLLGAAAEKPTEAVATEILLKTLAVGSYQRERCDHLPPHFLGLINPKMMQHVVLERSVRAKYDDQNHAQMGVVSYYYKECDNVIAYPEHCAIFHPDSIKVPTQYGANGKATAWGSAETWKVVPPADAIPQSPEV